MMSAIRLNMTTSTENVTRIAMMTGMSLFCIEVISSEPMPGTRKICSVISAPENTVGADKAISVTTGIRLLRTAWRLMTLNSATPLARAVRT